MVKATARRSIARLLGLRRKIYVLSNHGKIAWLERSRSVVVVARPFYDLAILSAVTKPQSTLLRPNA